MHHTSSDYSINKVFPGYETVVVLIHSSEQVCKPRLLVIHEFEELQDDGIKNVAKNLNTLMYPLPPIVP